MGKVNCIVDAQFAKYNCGPRGDGSTSVSDSDDRWYESNEGSKTNPSLGIYAGYAEWNDHENNPEGTFNWRSVIRFTVPSTLDKNVKVEEITVGITVMGGISTSYPYHSYAILSDKPPYDSKTRVGVKPSELCYSAEIVTNSSNKKRWLDCTMKSGVSICTHNVKAYAHLLENGKYIRPTKKVTTNTKLYYRFSPQSLSPGKTYYLYFVRQGKCDSSTGCAVNGHGASGYVHLRVMKKYEATVELSYANPVKFTVNASLDNGKVINNFSSYGNADFNVGNYVGKRVTSYGNLVPVGTNFTLKSVYPNAGYKFINTSDLGKTFSINSSLSYTLQFRTNYTLKFVYGGATKTYDKLKFEEFRMPTYALLFGDTPIGKSFVGWESGGMLFEATSCYNQDIDGLVVKTFIPKFSNNEYKIHYIVDGVIVHSQPVQYESTFQLPKISDDVMKTSERNFSGWLLNGEEFTGGTFLHTEDIEVEASFSRRFYTLEFKHGDTLVSTVEAEYGSDITNDVPIELSTEDFDSDYQKLEGWNLNSGPFIQDWEVLTNSDNCVEGKITLTAYIGPRYKIIVYKDGGWKRVTPIVSRETKQDEFDWHIIYPRIDKE